MQRKRANSMADQPLTERRHTKALLRLAEAPIQMRQAPEAFSAGQLHFKTIFIGESGSGKTQLVRRLIQSQFNPATPSTERVDKYEVAVHLGRCLAVLDVWDTAGQEKYHALTPQFFRDSLVCVIVYDVTDRKSFDNCRFWIERYLHETNPPPPAARLLEGDRPNVALVGTKCDMEHLRQVEREEAESLAVQHDMAFAEVTAIEGQGAGEIERLVHSLASNAFQALRRTRRNSDPALPVRPGGSHGLRLGAATDAGAHDTLEPDSCCA